MAVLTVCCHQSFKETLDIVDFWTQALADSEASATLCQLFVFASILQLQKRGGHQFRISDATSTDNRGRCVRLVNAASTLFDRKWTEGTKDLYAHVSDGLKVDFLREFLEQLEENDIRYLSRSALHFVSGTDMLPDTIMRRPKDCGGYPNARGIEEIGRRESELSITLSKLPEISSAVSYEEAYGLGSLPNPPEPFTKQEIAARSVQDALHSLELGFPPASPKVTLQDQFVLHEHMPEFADKIYPVVDLADLDPVLPPSDSGPNSVVPRRRAKPPASMKHESTRSSGASFSTARNSRSSTATFYSSRSSTTSAVARYDSIRSSYASLLTARSSRSSAATYYSARASTASIMSGSPSTSAAKSDWMAHLARRNMLPIPFDELNWSGRGQHTEFRKDEESQIPLKVEKVLGASGSAVVESVMCKRIRLARKTIQCNRKVKREDLIREVELLQKVSHSHIIQAVGTYLIDRTLSILLYPATEYNLETFLSIEDDISPAHRSICLEQFFQCLAYSMHFLHSKAIKHMDIKPKNLLVRYMQSSKTSYSLRYKIYIADFGISRSYASAADSETDSSTSFTKKYAAPEVVDPEVLGLRRGLSADIFSLGCVYAEIFAALIGRLDELDQVISRGRDTSYQANIQNVQEWFSSSPCLEGGLSDFSHPYARQIPHMLDSDPSLRPTARHLAEQARFLTHCCFSKADPFEAAVV